MRVGAVALAASLVVVGPVAVEQPGAEKPGRVGLDGVEVVGIAVEGEHHRLQADHVRPALVLRMRAQPAQDFQARLDRFFVVARVAAGEHREQRQADGAAGRVRFIGEAAHVPGAVVGLLAEETFALGDGLAHPGRQRLVVGRRRPGRGGRRDQQHGGAEGGGQEHSGDGGAHGGRLGKEGRRHLHCGRPGRSCQGQSEGSERSGRVRGLRPPGARRVRPAVDGGPLLPRYSFFCANSHFIIAASRYAGTHDA